MRHPYQLARAMIRVTSMMSRTLASKDGWTMVSRSDMSAVAIILEDYDRLRTRDIETRTPPPQGKS
jgi:hypothetical protein